MKWSATKKAAMHSSYKFGPMVKAGAAAPAAFALVDNGDSTFTVVGLDAVSNPVDISGVATLGATSDDPTIVTVDAPTGMTFGVHAVGPIGKCNIDVVATWNDGSIGPFSASQEVDTVTGPAASVVINVGPITTH